VRARLYREVPCVDAARPPSDRAAVDARDLLDVAAVFVAAAAAREESRGAHTRTDFADRSDRYLGRFVHHGVDELVWVPLPDADRVGAG
jgi:succinate dehydrogenase/fumarate reductase flavoprotein subunit